MIPIVRGQPIATGAEWNFDVLEKYDRAIAEIAAEFGLDTYPNQIEVITSEQMLDAYASNGLPIGYTHWSYGKEFLRNEESYRTGKQGLAYEIVINSSPCISYLMEENPLAIQVLVIAHAGYGHNSFFKGNFLFREWTDAEAIINYMVFARKYVMDCEERYGVGAVEEVLDSCHALADYGVDRYRRPSTRTFAQENERNARLRREEEFHYDDLVERTKPSFDEHGPGKRMGKHAREKFPADPQENILYFIHKYSPKLKPWQKELARIVMKVQQYFYPQALTKVMNEGWATFWHYTIINRLYEKGLVDDGFMVEFLKSHTNVIMQPPYDSPFYGGINPYALGFAMFSDIRRICEDPTEEDRRWFPTLAGTDWKQSLDFAMRNFKDESFVGQYLSPKLMRDFPLFTIADKEGADELVVDAIHNDEGYQRVRKMLALHYSREERIPDIQITEYRRDSDRVLELTHTLHRGRPLNEDSAIVMQHLARLWGFPVELKTVTDEGNQKSTETFPPSHFEFEELEDKV